MALFVLVLVIYSFRLVLCCCTAGVLLCALYSILLYVFVGLASFRFVFLTRFLVRVLEYLAASKFWLFRAEGLTVFLVGLAFRVPKVPFFSLRFLLSILFVLASGLSLFWVAALLADTVILIPFSLFIEPRRTSVLLLRYSVFVGVLWRSYPFSSFVIFNCLKLGIVSCSATSCSGFSSRFFSIVCLRLFTICVL